LQKTGNFYPSFTSGLLELHEKEKTLTEAIEEEIKGVAATFYVGT
jgi:hypothetical protein